MAFNRVKQWMTFSRVWYLFDAKWQDPNEAARVIATYLLGKHKPIFSIPSDCGDHVVVINSKKISLSNELWRTFNFFHHTGYAKGATYTPAWEFHKNDPTKIIELCVRNEMPNKIYRKNALTRLLVYPDENIPQNILDNITDQIPGISRVPTPLQEVSQEDIDKFPRLFEMPQEFNINTLKGSNENDTLLLQSLPKKQMKK